MRAYIDGCNSLAFFGVSCCPLARPALAAIAALTMIVSWNDLLTPLVILNSDTLWTLPLGTMQFQGQYSSDLALTAAFVTLSALPCHHFLSVRRTTDRFRPDCGCTQRLMGRKSHLPGENSWVLPKPNLATLTPRNRCPIRVQDLLVRLTLDEKIAQMSSIWFKDLQVDQELSAAKMQARFGNGIGQVTRVGGSSTLAPIEAARAGNAIQRFLQDNTRLGIPAILHEESCVGYMGLGGTIFPQMIGLASTWSPELAERMAFEIRKQLLAVGARQALAPVLDISRDPRWGRTEETFGEDPVLVSAAWLSLYPRLARRRLADWAHGHRQAFCRSQPVCRGLELRSLPGRFQYIMGCLSDAIPGCHPGGGFKIDHERLPRAG